MTDVQHAPELTVAGGHVVAARRRPLRTVGSAITAATGTVVGLAPHVLHHIGPLVGTALVAGVGGQALFGLVGLIAALPMLVRLRRRSGTWWAPGLALLAFAAAFVVSTTVIGPMISGDGVPSEVTPSAPADHDQHH
ncbi:hypothetical protein CBP52_14845 [Cellulomonas sp. PSBB021]|nr:hypothetical protein CBP52_14845 [Cellulomonas sp. PSBB021]